MSRTNIREQAAQILSSHQGFVAGTVVLLVAFSVVAGNAVFNQPGSHPYPLWHQGAKLITHSIPSDPSSVPIRKVAVSQVPAAKIPVPRTRPGATHLPTKNTIDQILTTSGDNFKVQELLTKLGHYKGPVDGLVGAKTRTAIKIFQRKSKLPADGQYDSKLLSTMQKAIAGNKKPTPTPVSRVNIPKHLSAKNSAMITRIQVGLINFGNRDVAIDGLLGKQTKQAIQQFQKRFDLEVTGLPSKALVHKLESVGALTRG